MMAFRFFGSFSILRSAISRSFSSWHHQPANVQRSATCSAGSAEKTKPVEKTSHSSGFSMRLFCVAQSTTWRSTVKPASSICCLATSAFLYMNSYSLVVIHRTGWPA